MEESQCFDRKYDKVTIDKLTQHSYVHFDALYLEMCTAIARSLLVSVGFTTDWTFSN